jgi:hypothetical protein
LRRGLRRGLSVGGGASCTAVPVARPERTSPNFVQNVGAVPLKRALQAIITATM